MTYESDPLKCRLQLPESDFGKQLSRLPLDGDLKGFQGSHDQLRLDITHKCKKISLTNKYQSIFLGYS